MQTAKTIQLMDGSNNFISPATNIESLYYETVGTDENQNIIYRHQVSQHFPVYVNSGEDTTISGVTIKNVKNSSIVDLSTNKSRLVDADGSDIIISNFIQKRLDGTNYYKLDISSYNLSEILQQFAGVSYVDTRIKDLSTFIETKQQITIDNVNNTIEQITNNILDLSARVNNTTIKLDDLYDGIKYNKICKYYELKEIKNKGNLIPNCNYLMEYNLTSLYEKSQNEYFNHPFVIVLRSIDSCTFDSDVVTCMSSDNYYKNNKLNQWQVKFDFDQIIGETWMYYKNDLYTKVENASISFKTNNEVCIQFDKVNYIYQHKNGPNILVQITEKIVAADTSSWNAIDSSITQDIPEESILLIKNVDNINTDNVYRKKDASINISVVDPDRLVYPGGIITYMKDEFGNEAPFDFKNRKQNGSKYLFSYSPSASNASDYSLDPLCHDNTVYSDSSNIRFDTSSRCNIKYNVIGYGSSNILIRNASSTSASNDKGIENNIINNNNSSISIITNNKKCYNNVIANNNYDILINNGVNNNIQNNNSNITINNASNNIIASYCVSVNIAGGSMYNIIESGCYNIKLNQYSQNTIINQECQNIIKNSGEAISNITIGPNVTTANSITYNTYYTYQNIYARGFNTISNS